MHSEHERDMMIFAGTLSDVVMVFVFVVVGANLPFGLIADHALPGIAVIPVCMLVARPLSVLACTLPDRRARCTAPELAFLSWMRETGVVPVALVGVLAGVGVPDGDALASVVAIAIIATLVAQAMPAPCLARRLGLLEPGAAADAAPAVALRAAAGRSPSGGVR